MTNPQPRSPSSWNTLISRLEQALDELSANDSLADLERWAVDLFTAMGGPLRRFHTLDHLFRFQPRDAIESLAVLYHDVVYWSVDGGWPLGFAPLLEGVVPQGGGPESRLGLSSEVPHYEEILSVFDRRPGDVLGPGSNELLSALAFAATLGHRLGRETTLAVVTCIEATIPFRGPQARAQLHARLLSFGVAAPDADAWLVRAVHMANQDVGDFRLSDPGEFLGGTWNLLPELNPDLRISAVFTLQAYRKALVAMRKFFGFLRADLLFDSWGDEPGPEVLAAWKEQAERNLSVARGYLGAKLLAASLLEACARETGPDVPLSLFMGAATDPAEDRLEALLPSLPGEGEGDPVYFLLEWGRSTQSHFDLTNSPLAAWIYRQLSPDDRSRLEALANELFAGTLPPRDYLVSWPSAIVAPLLQALATFVPTRKRPLLSLAQALSMP